MNKTDYRIQSYFAAANTADGFHSRFSTLFDPGCGKWQKIYIIKGGPGTGKSGFMKRCAEAAAKKGYAVETYYCSSDTRSLDGVRIPALGIALLDGTAPHATDPVYPGAVEEILNMGLFFDTAQLREHSEDIRALHARNAACHARASRFLRAAGAMRDTMRRLAGDALLNEKTNKAAARLLRQVPAAKEPVQEEQIVTAISTQGVVHLSTAEKCAGTCVYVTDRHGLAAEFFDALVNAAQARGVSYVRYAAPLQPRETEGLYLPDRDIVYFTDRYGKQSEDCEIINVGRFFSGETLAASRACYRFTEKCYAALLEGACEALAEAGSIHDKLETYYIDAMDFSALDAYTARFLKSLF